MMTRREIMTMADSVAVTLDGQPAKVVGARNDFATVRIIKSGLGCEWAWVTVERILSKGGAFLS